MPGPGGPRARGYSHTKIYSLLMIGALERFFNRSTTKFVLAFLIILSVLPLPEIRKFDLVFFAIFGVELVVRFILFARMKERRRLFEAFMLIIDTVAVLSFLPIPHQVVQTRYLRLVRLFRLSLLLRFAASLARDMWNIVARKEIKYQLSFLFGAVAILTFLSGIVLHALQVPVDLNNDGAVEIGSLKDVLWWSFREIESQDNITQNLDGPFIFIAFSFVLTLAGVFVMSLLIGVGSSVVEKLLTASKEKPVALFDHTVVIGRGRNLLHLLQMLVRIMKKNRERPAIALLSDSDDPPNFLYENELRKVEYRTGDPSELRSLRLVNTKDAKKVLIVYDDEKKQLADAYSISTVLAVRERSTCPIFLEMRHEESLQAARDAAGADITPVPMGKFLGTILCQNVIFPGMDRIFEELLTSRGSEIYTTFFSEKEKRQLREMNAAVNFADLLVHAYREFGVIMLGGFTEEKGSVKPLINPMEAGGGRDGSGSGFSTAGLTGLIGLTRERRLLGKVKDLILSGGQPETFSREAGDRVGFKLSESMTRLRHVLVIGENENLPSFIEETARFVPRVEFTIVIPGKQRGDSVMKALAEKFDCTLVLDKMDQSHWDCGHLEGRYNLTVISFDDDFHMILNDADLWEKKDFDVVVFLSDMGAADPDAQSLLWLFKLMDMVDGGGIRVGPNFHVLTEVAVSEKGELVEKRFKTARDRRVRALSTQKIRTYFMAQSCFITSIWDVYNELLRSEGMDFCQVVLRDPKGKAAFSELLETFASHGVILFGIELIEYSGDSPIIINPSTKKGEEKIDLANIKQLYVIGDTDTIIEQHSSRGSIPP